MHKHANVWWSMQLHELCPLHTDSLFPAALAAVLSSCAATGEQSLLVKKAVVSTLQRQAFMSRFNESMGGSPVIGCAGCEVLRHTRARQGFRQGVV
jgi:hypothetical protein